MAKKEAAVATVLAFEKKLVPSDGYLYGSSWEQRHTSKATPLALIEKSVRGTVSNYIKPSSKEEDNLKGNVKVTSPNLQTVDYCSLGEHQDTLKLSFTLKVLGGVEKPSACNNELFAQSYLQVAQQYIEEEGFIELAKRYALNIANARFLWRNRVGAEKIEVVAKTSDGEQWTFDALTYPLRHFDKSDADVDALATKIAAALSGRLPYLLISIDAYALVGNAQEVYPSEELVLDKSREDKKGKKSKILYAVNNVAALHSQKVGNAIRTIDTWYPDYATAKVGAIAIEPYGVVTTLGKAYRNPNDKANFYSLFYSFALGGKLNSKEEKHYVMAVLVRGGVFGQSGKE